jgi:acetylornithine/LysW-gamma-L-lysine aminotransferase
VFVRGEGCWLIDSDDRRYLDLSSAQGVAMLGHSHPSIVDAISRQAATLISCPNYLYSDVRAEFAAALVDVLPAHLPFVFLANSGAEAIDGALKFARLATKRTSFVAATKGFHGRTFGALSVTWEPKYREGFGPLLDVVHVPFNSVTALDAAITDTTAAVVLEVVQGESGVNIGSAEFLQAAGLPSSMRRSSPTSCVWRKGSAGASRWARSLTHSGCATSCTRERTAARSAGRRSRVPRAWRR